MDETIKNFLDEQNLNFNSVEFDTSHNYIKIIGVPNEQRLSKELQEFLGNKGFSYVYFVHTDGWITPYITKKEISIG